MFFYFDTIRDAVLFGLAAFRASSSISRQLEPVKWFDLDKQAGFAIAAAVSAGFDN